MSKKSTCIRTVAVALAVGVGISFSLTGIIYGQDSRQLVETRIEVYRDHSLEGRVNRVVAETFGIDVKALSPADRFFDDFGIDSLDFVELIMAFEEEFGIIIADADAGKMERIADAITYLREKTPQ